MVAKQAQSPEEVQAWEKAIKEKLGELQKSANKDVKNEKICSNGGGGLVRRQSSKELEDKASEDFNSETPKEAEANLQAGIGYQGSLSAVVLLLHSRAECCLILQTDTSGSWRDGSGRWQLTDDSDMLRDRFASSRSKALLPGRNADSPSSALADFLQEDLKRYFASEEDRKLFLDACRMDGIVPRFPIQP